MPNTIDPSLLSRHPNVKDVRRRLLESGRKRAAVPVPAPNDPQRQPPVARNTDILVRADEMKKKIWHYTKLQRVLDVMFDPDPLGSVKAPKTEQTNLAQLLNKERANGPSDRDPTVSTKELVYFKGPYIYLYDIEEKQKPIMVREYNKVADKLDGDWPQFRISKDGRCPFVEDPDAAERHRRAEKSAHEKERQLRRERAAVKAAREAAPELKPPPPPPLGRPIDKSVAPKRPLADMMMDANEKDAKARAVLARVPERFDLTKATNPPSIDFNAFTSHARGARQFAGEPVASGLQPSNITSAIRSQMISSATGVLGAKAGTSKEVHGLQRKVLQKSNLASANSTSQDTGSRRLADMSIETSTYQRSASLGIGSRKLGQIDEDKVKEHKRTMSVPFPAPAKPKKRELKPGYCENCQDKFDDFDEVRLFTTRSLEIKLTFDSTFSSRSIESSPRTPTTGPVSMHCCHSWSAFPSMKTMTMTTRAPSALRTTEQGHISRGQ